MRRFSILLAPLLLLAGYAVGRLTATPAPLSAAQDAFPAPISRPVPVADERAAAPPAVKIQSASPPASTELRSPQQVFHDEFYKPYASQEVSAKVVADAGQPVFRQRAAVQNDIDPFGAPAPSRETNSSDFAFEEPKPRSAPAFIPTPLAAKTEQEEKYLSAALKVFRGLGETERQAEFEQMIGRMEEQDAAAELLRLRTELQQLSEKYPKTGAGKKALEAIQTLPVVNPPEVQPGAKAEEAAAPAAPLPANPGFIQDLR